MKLFNKVIVYDGYLYFLDSNFSSFHRHSNKNMTHHDKYLMIKKDFFVHTHYGITGKDYLLYKMFYKKN